MFGPQPTEEEWKVWCNKNKQLWDSEKVKIMNKNYCKTQFENALNTLEKSLDNSKTPEEYHQSLINISKALKYGLECLSEID